MTTLCNPSSRNRRVFILHLHSENNATHGPKQTSSSWSTTGRRVDQMSSWGASRFFGLRVKLEALAPWLGLQCWTWDFRGKESNFADFVSSPQFTRFTFCLVLFWIRFVVLGMMCRKRRPNPVGTVRILGIQTQVVGYMGLPHCFSYLHGPSVNMFT